MALAPSSLRSVLTCTCRLLSSTTWAGASNSTATFGHFGQSGTFFWVDPVAELALIALTDRGFGDWARPAWPARADAVLAVPTA